MGKRTSIVTNKRGDFVICFLYMPCVTLTRCTLEVRSIRSQALIGSLLLSAFHLRGNLVQSVSAARQGSSSSRSPATRRGLHPERMQFSSARSMSVMLLEKESLVSAIFYNCPNTLYGIVEYLPGPPCPWCRDCPMASLSSLSNCLLPCQRAI